MSRGGLLACERGIQERPVPALIAHEHERMALELSPGESLPARQGVVVAADQHEAVLVERVGRELRVLGPGDRDSELDFASQHGVDHARRGVIVDLDAIAGMSLRVLLDDARKILDANGGHARDRNVTALGSPCLADLYERGRQLPEQSARLRQESLTEGSEGHRARGALDQPDTQHLFEVL